MHLAAVYRSPNAFASTAPRGAQARKPTAHASSWSTARAAAGCLLSIAIALLAAVLAAADSASTSGAVTNRSELDFSESDLAEMHLWNETIGDANHSAPATVHTGRNLSHEIHTGRNLSIKVNPFWLRFQPPSSMAYQTMAVVYIVISSIGCFGNAFVIFMFLRFKSLRTPSNVLVINLAISDWLMMAKCPIAIYNNFMEGPALGDWGCRLYGFVGGLTGTTSIITLTAIAIDRYNVIVHPLDPLRYSSKIRSRCALVLIWLYSLAFSVIPALDIGLSVYVPEGFLTTCSFDYLDRTWEARVFMFVFFVCAWCVPFVTIVYCYVYILNAVRSARSIQSSKDKSKTEIKLAAVIFAIIALWFLAWTPYSVVALLGMTGNEDKLTPLGSMIPALFCKSSACIDPYIYAATHPRFRMEFRRLIQGGLPVRRSSTWRSSILSRSTNSKTFHLRRSISSVAPIQNPGGEMPHAVNMAIIVEKDGPKTFTDGPQEATTQNNLRNAEENSRF